MYQRSAWGFDKKIHWPAASPTGGEHFLPSGDLRSYAKNIKLQIDPSISNLNQFYTCFRVTLVDCISVCQTENI